MVVVWAKPPYTFWLTKVGSIKCIVNREIYAHVSCHLFSDFSPARLSCVCNWFDPPKPDYYQVIVIHNCVIVQINLFKSIYYLYLDRIGEIKPLIRTKSRFYTVHSRSLVQSSLGFWTGCCWGWGKLEGDSIARKEEEEMSYYLFCWIKFSVFCISPKLGLKNGFNIMNIYFLWNVRIVCYINDIAAFIDMDYSPKTCTIDTKFAIFIFLYHTLF